MSLQEQIEKINEWQEAVFLHPLTCIVSKHGNLYPVEQNGKIVLKCRKCRYVQEKIPPSVLEIPDGLIASEKQKLIEKGFKF